MQMFRDLIEFPITTDKVTWEASQVLRDMGEKSEPHILLRLKLSGTYFDQGALESYVSVGNIRSLFVEISRDGLTARAYFDQPLPEDGTIEFGYDHESLIRISRKFSTRTFEQLDVNRLPKNTRFVNRFFEND